MKMKINDDLLRQMESDLSINAPFIKGKDNPVKNCWHFCTDGNAVDRLFDDREDFKDGMNRVYSVGKKYAVAILAFCLMDTHVHFVIYGEFDECNKFIHDYIKLTSIRISNKYREKNKLHRIPISHQYIDNEFYLKTAICYVIKNPPVGGIPGNAYDYPWGSGPLYFRNSGEWSSPAWTNGSQSENLTFNNLNVREKRLLLRSKKTGETGNVKIIDGIIFPGEYVAYQIVERVFKTHKSFNFFMGITKEEDIEKRGGSLSLLSIPIQEMRQHRNEICMELFQMKTIRTLNTQERLKLARTLRKRFKSSPKQICRLCGLVYEEVKGIIK